MIKVTFIEHNGTVRNVEVEEGTSLMDAAVGNLVPGSDGDCGGVSACGTCHLFIEAEWRDKVSPVEETERSMLDFVEDDGPGSRLGCQIKLTRALDGLVARTPVGQH